MKRKPSLPETPKALALELRRARAKILELERDLHDCLAARQTAFRRCPGCGRLSEQGLICRTNMSGGDCEKGK